MRKMVLRPVVGKIPWRQILFRIGILIGGGIFCYQLFRGASAFVNSNFTINNPVLLVFSLLILLVVRGFQMTAWHSLMKAVGVPLSWANVAEKYTLTLLSRYVPGSIWGYISRAEWMLKEYQVPYGVTNFISVAEMVLVITTCVQVIAAYWVLHTQSWLRIGLAILILGLFFVPWLFIQKLNRSNSINHLMIKMFRLFETRQIPFSSWIKVAIFNILAWYGFGLAFYWIIQSIQPNPLTTIDLLTMVYGLSWLAGFVVVFVPSGLGVREQSITSLLTSFGIVTNSGSSLAAILMRLLISTGELLWLGFGLILRHTRQIKK